MAKSKSMADVSPGSVLAEYVGTFSLAFAVLASINGVLGSFVPTPVIAAFTLFIAVLTIGQISGAHINPAITLGLWSARRVDFPQAVSYVIAQVAGAFSAAAVLNTLLDGSMLTIIAGQVDTRIFTAEAVGMAFFAFGVAAAVFNDYKGIEAAAVVGGSLFLGIIIASVLSNGILNPAVALAIDSANIVYLLAPVVGAIVGVHLYGYIKSQD